MTSHRTRRGSAGPLVIVGAGFISDGDLVFWNAERFQIARDVLRFRSSKEIPLLRFA